MLLYPKFFGLDDLFVCDTNLRDGLLQDMSLGGGWTVGPRPCWYWLVADGHPAERRQARPGPAVRRRHRVGGEAAARRARAAARLREAKVKEQGLREHLVEHDHGEQDDPGRCCEVGIVQEEGGDPLVIAPHRAAEHVPQTVARRFVEPRRRRDVGPRSGHGSGGFFLRGFLRAFLRLSFRSEP